MRHQIAGQNAQPRIESSPAGGGAVEDHRREHELERRTQGEALVEAMTANRAVAGVQDRDPQTPAAFQSGDLPLEVARPAPLVR